MEKIAKLNKTAAFELFRTVLTGDEDYADWQTRIENRFRYEHPEQWFTYEVTDDQDAPIGFVIFSKSRAKLISWKNKFASVSHKLDTSNSLQLVYAYVKPNFRGEGKTSELLSKIFAELGQSPVNVYVHTHDRDRIAFWERMQFRKVLQLTDVHSEFHYYGVLELGPEI
jgi:ribosomal protein S18 acetylase RimI-like enzyme